MFKRIFRTTYSYMNLKLKINYIWIDIKSPGQFMQMCCKKAECLKKEIFRLLRMNELEIMRTLVLIKSSDTAAVIPNASDGEVPRPSSSMITKLVFVTCCNKYVVSLISDIKEDVPISENVLSFANLESN